MYKFLIIPTRHMIPLHALLTDKVKIAKKGQIVLRKQRVETPEDKILEIISSFPSFDAATAWKEVQEERRQERA